MRPFALVVALLLVLLGAPGCIHTDLHRNLPGHVDLATPPRAPAGHSVELPVDPGQRAVVVHLSGQSGGGAAQLDGALHGFGDVGGELSVTPNSVDRSQWGGVMGPRGPWRVNVGAMVMGVADDGGTHGQSYGELQYTWFDELLSGSIAVGPTWAWDKLAGGPQMTACAGPIPVVSLCARGSYLAGEGAQVGVRLVVFAGLAEWVWSR